MTVAELIAYLETKNPNLPVVYFARASDWGYLEISQTATHPDKIELIGRKEPRP
jgi:hypothetical protein